MGRSSAPERARAALQPRGTPFALYPPVTETTLGVRDADYRNPRRARGSGHARLRIAGARANGAGGCAGRRARETVRIHAMVRGEDPARAALGDDRVLV